MESLETYLVMATYASALITLLMIILIPLLLRKRIEKRFNK